MGKMVSKRCSWGSTGEVYPEPTSGKGRHRVLPAAVRRDLQHKSTDGGTAVCCKCHTRFSMQFIRLCYVGFLQQDHVCCDCKKQYQLQPV